MSTREVARVTGHDRKTISKIWNEYQLLSSQLGQAGADIKALQARMTEEPRYDSRRRVRHKYSKRQTTPRMDRHETIVTGRFETFRYYRYWRISR